MAEPKGYIRTADEHGSVNIGQNVVVTIAAAAAVDVDGVYGLYQSARRELTEVAGQKGISKGVRVTIEEDNIVVDVALIAEIGANVSEVACDVQKAVKAAIEEAIGSSVRTVNVNICGVSLKKTKPKTQRIQNETGPGSESKTAGAL